MDNRYDDLKELKLWEELKLRYQEEIEMGNELEQNKFLVEHAELQIDTLKKKLETYKQNELYRTTPSYEMASQAFENQNTDWKPDSEKSQEFRNICKNNFPLAVSVRANAGVVLSQNPRIDNGTSFATGPRQDLYLVVCSQ